MDRGGQCRISALQFLDKNQGALRTVRGSTAPFESVGRAAVVRLKRSSDVVEMASKIMICLAVPVGQQSAVSGAELAEDTCGQDEAGRQDGVPENDDADAALR